MKHTFRLLLLFAALTAGTLRAQAPVLPAGIMPVVGDQAAYTIDTITKVLSGGPAGASQTWTFSGLSNQILDTLEWQAPAGKPFAGDYPTATSVAHIGDFYFYYNTNNDTLMHLGSAGSLFGISKSLKNSQAVPELYVGGTLGTSFQRSFWWEASMSGTEVDAIQPGASSLLDSVRLKRSTLRVSTYDGWGSLSVNGTAYSGTLREKAIDYITDSTWYKRSGGGWTLGLVVAPIPFVLPNGVNLPGETKDTLTTYTWWKDGEDYSILEFVVNNRDSVEKATLRYLTTGTVGVQSGTGSLPLALYPNPATDAVWLQAPVGTAIPAGATLQLTDLTGRSLLTSHLSDDRTQQLALPAGTAPGIYVATVQAGGQLLWQQRLAIR